MRFDSDNDAQRHAQRARAHRRLNEEQRAIVDAALRLVVSGARHQAKYTHSAHIPWARVHELRRALKTAGYEWPAIYESTRNADKGDDRDG